MANVFLSYRREDSRADAGRLYDHLSARFGADSVFMDIDDIAAGENFVEKLSSVLGQCHVLLVVIGPHWLHATDDEGHARLAAPQDFVRLELHSALERGIALIPVLVGGARMPERGELPSQLADLVVHQASVISDERFREDVERLIAAIERVTGPAAMRRRMLPALLALALAGLALGLYLAYGKRAGGAAALRSAPTELSIAAAKAMVAGRGLYDPRWNPVATGPRHDYAVEVAAGAVLVVDRAAGLAWQKDGSTRAMTFADTADYLHTLNAQRHGGHDDWRLPTLEEAMALLQPVDAEHYYVDQVFERGAAPFVWTADSAAPARHWVVYYYDGAAAAESEQFNAYVRAVRGAR